MLDSARPIWEQIMNIEYLRLAQLRDLICDVVHQKAIRQCRTEAHPRKKKAEELKTFLKDQTFQSIQCRTPFTPIPPPERLTKENPFRILALDTPEKLDKHALKLTYTLLSHKPSPMYPVMVPSPLNFRDACR